MSSIELNNKLKEEGFKKSSYSLAEEIADEALCLRKEKQGWCVYYSERGLKTGMLHFDSELDACEYFYKEMREDPTTHESWSSGYSMNDSIS